jgi:hypothetical protein
MDTLFNMPVVMAGLVPAIPVFVASKQDVDARHKAGHDEYNMGQQQVSRMPSAPAVERNRPPGLAELHTAAAVRERCALVYRWVADGHSPHFSLEESRIPSVADYVADVTREAYPDLKIPYHSRWRHFSAGGIDRWSGLAARGADDPIERARMAVDLVTVSVLLDAGAGDAWRYREHDTGHPFTRSEGLAVASLHMFRSGLFSADADRPCRVDSIALANIEPATLARHFQVDAANPLVGVEQRSTLLRRLGQALAERPDLFATTPPRLGHLVDYFLGIAGDRCIAAATVLTTLLQGLSSIWPSGLAVNGFPVGDAGRHPAVRKADASDQIVPFHKLSQWLTYSLIEPLAAAGIRVHDLDELTALAEYRNGGLLVDLGLIRPRAEFDPQRRHDVRSEPIVEWRALTVALVDRLLEPVRAKLGLDASFTMPQLLEGGTWSAGRRIALALRPPDGPPPIAVVADGTVF